MTEAAPLMLSVSGARGIVDASIAQLTSTYIENANDNQARLQILQVLGEMRDARSIPALIEALNWRPEVNEEHAISAAQTLSNMDIPEDKKGEVVSALTEALRKVTQARPVDNRLRRNILLALGSIDHPDVATVLIEIATRQEEAQHFAVNRAAAQQLANVAGEESIQPMEVLVGLAPS